MKYDDQIFKTIESKIEKGNYKVFDNRAKVVTRRNFPNLIEQGKTGQEHCLVITNSEGETMVITAEFEQILANAVRIN